MSTSNESTQTLPNDIITLKAGSIDLHVQSSALTKASTYFKALFAPHMTGLKAPARTSDGAYIVIADPDVFKHIVTFAEYRTYPLFYQQKSGFDLGRYAEVYHLAKYYGVDKLAEWIREKKYADVFKCVTYTNYLTRGEYLTWTQEDYRETAKAQPKGYEGNEEMIPGQLAHPGGPQAKFPLLRHSIEIDYDALVDTS